MFWRKKIQIFSNLAISNVRQRDVADLDIVVPLVEQLDVANLLDNILGEGVGNDRVLDLDFTAVRHLGLFAVENSGAGAGLRLVLRIVEM